MSAYTQNTWHRNCGDRYGSTLTSELSKPSKVHELPRRISPRFIVTAEYFNQADAQVIRFARNLRNQIFVDYSDDNDGFTICDNSTELVTELLNDGFIRR